MAKAGRPKMLKEDKKVKKLLSLSHEVIQKLKDHEARTGEKHSQLVERLIMQSL